MQPTPSLVIADDHPLVLKGLEDFLVEQNQHILATAKNGKEALAVIKAHEPDIAVLDVRMPFLTGIEVAHAIKKLKLKTKVILITFEKSADVYQQATSADVYGYILKEFALEEIEKCISKVSEGQSYFSKQLLDVINVNEDKDALSELTPAEKNILRHLASNKSAKEIANDLCISVRTVEKHKSTIRQKLKLDSKIGTLYLYAYTHLRFL